jgi:hypothetical protein
MRYINIYSNKKTDGETLTSKTYTVYPTEETNTYSHHIFKIQAPEQEFNIVNNIPRRYIINDRELNEIRYRTIDLGNVIKEEKIAATFSVDEIVEYPSFFGEEKRFKYTITDRLRRKHVIGPGPITEIRGVMNSLGLFVDPKIVTQVINNLKQLKEGLGEIEISKQPPYEGFFWNKRDEKIFSNPPMLSKPSIDNIDIALNMLEKFVDCFPGFKKNFGYVLWWIAFAPFSFAKKRVKKNGFQPGLLLFGDTQAGKSTTAKTMCHIWRRSTSDYALNGSDVDTPYNLAEEGQIDTYPRIIDEGEALYQKPALLNMLKNIPEKEHSRTRQNTDGIRVSSIALSNLLLTSNRAKPNEGALTARIRTLEYFLEPRDQDDIDWFNEFFEPIDDNGALSILGFIGDYFGNVMCEDERLIKEPWEDCAKMLWTFIYQEAGRPIPSWLENPAKTDTVAGTVNSQGDANRDAIKETLLDGWHQSMQNAGITNNMDRLDALIDNGVAKNIYRYTPSRGSGSGVPRYIVTRGFEQHLRPKIGEKLSLEMIAKISNGKYQEKCRVGKNKRVNGVYWDKKEMEELLGV